MIGRAKLIYAFFALAVFAGAGVTAIVLRESTSLHPIATFTTDLAPRSVEQKYNIARAAARLDGIMVKPGAEFSFNRTVGQCGVEQGYELAPAIVAGEMRKSWGGGVCQVSSTLYNAALLADLKITERRAHSRGVSSVPPGRDATTAFGIADLRFVNTTGALVRIRAAIIGSRLTIGLMGESRARPDVAIVTENSGGAGHQTVIAYRVIHSPGGEERRELISTDTYLGAAASPATTR